MAVFRNIKLLFGPQSSQSAAQCQNRAANGQHGNPPSHIQPIGKIRFCYKFSLSGKALNQGDDLPGADSFLLPLIVATAEKGIMANPGDNAMKNILTVIPAVENQVTLFGLPAQGYKVNGIPSVAQHGVHTAAGNHQICAAAIFQLQRNNLNQFFHWYGGEVHIGGPFEYSWFGIGPTPGASRHPLPKERA